MPMSKTATLAAETAPKWMRSEFEDQQLEECDFVVTYFLKPREPEQERTSLRESLAKLEEKGLWSEESSHEGIEDYMAPRMPGRVFDLQPA